MQTLLKEGAELHLAGRLADAERCYRQALEIDDSSAVAHNNLAFLLMQRREFAEAEQEYRRAIELSPAYATAYTNLGQAYLLMQRWDEAEEYLTRATELDADAFHAYESLAKLAMVYGDSNRAVSYWEEANRIRPVRENLVNLAHCLVQQRRLDEARDVLIRAADSDDEDARLHALFGIIAFAQYDFGSAIRHFKRALGIEPENTETRHNLAMAYLKTGQSEEAVMELRRILLLMPDHVEARNNLAVIELAAGEPDSALEHFNLILEQAPDNTKALYYKGVVLLQQGKTEAARALLEKITRTTPNEYQSQAAELLSTLV
ncbi:MAG: tetratricopeptide repeat protein [Desulfobulbus sp.]|nr:tetratricopeptide repeat protein [Desulfobulbus sp.]